MDTKTANSLSGDKPHSKRIVLLVLCAVIVLFGVLVFFLPDTARRVEPSDQKAVALLQGAVSGLADQLLSDFPNDLYLIKLCVRSYATNQSSKALALLEEKIGADFEDYDLYILAGNLSHSHGLHDKAVTYWREGLKHTSQKTKIRMKIADALMFSGKYAEAISELKKDISSGPGSLERNCLLGQGYLQLREYEKSKQFYLKAIALSPNYPKANFGLGKVYMRLRQPDKAGPYMEKYEKAYAGMLDNRYKKKEGQDSVDSSLENLSDLFFQLSTHGNTLYKLPANAKGARVLAEGEKVFEDAIALAPDKSSLYRAAASFYLATSADVDKACKFAEKSVDLDATAKNYSVLASCYYSKSDKAKAIAAIEKAVGLDGKNRDYKMMHNAIKGLR